MASLLLAQFEEIRSHYCDFAFDFHLQSHWGLNLRSHQASFTFKNSISTYLVFALLLFLHSALQLQCFLLGPNCLGISGSKPQGSRPKGEKMVASKGLEKSKSRHQYKWFLTWLTSQVPQESSSILWQGHQALVYLGRSNLFVWNPKKSIWMALKTACYTWNDTPTQICIHSSQRGHDLASWFHHSTLEHRQVPCYYMVFSGFPMMLLCMCMLVTMSLGSVIQHFLISS